MSPAELAYVLAAERRALWDKLEALKQKYCALVYRREALRIEEHDIETQICEVEAEYRALAGMEPECE